VSAIEAGVVAFRSVTVRLGGERALDQVTVDVPAGAVFALLGPGDESRQAFLRCPLGRVRPDEGTCFVFGKAAWPPRRAAGRRIGAVLSGAAAGPGPSAVLPRLLGRLLPRRDASPPSESLARLRGGLTPPPDLLVLDDAALAPDPAARRELLEPLLQEAAGRGAAVLIATADSPLVERAATHVGILRKGRLVLEGRLGAVKARYRRIRYSNERTEERTEFGTELDAFDAVRVRVRGWGIDAVVSNFDEEAFERFRAIEGVVDAQAETLSLEEILAAVSRVGR
jgi:ABC-2 type transport system ATP-binding protein